MEGRDQMSLELALEFISSKVNQVNPVKVEEEEEGGQWHKKALPISKLRYSQKSIKMEFKDGRQFNELLKDLRSGRVNPESHPKMLLEVVEASGRFYSNDNRRLKVLKMFREETKREVFVQCKVFPWHPAYERFQERYSERQAAGLADSDDIRVRKAPRTVSS